MENINKRWLKQVARSGWQVKDYIGSYFLVVTDGETDCCRIKMKGDTISGAFSRDRINSGEFELMPEDFTPEGVEQPPLPIFNI